MHSDIPSVFHSSSTVPLSYTIFFIRLINFVFICAVRLRKYIQGLLRQNMHPSSKLNTYSAWAVAEIMQPVIFRKKKWNLAPFDTKVTRRSCSGKHHQNRVQRSHWFYTMHAGHDNILFIVYISIVSFMVAISNYHHTIIIALMGHGAPHQLVSLALVRVLTIVIIMTATLRSLFGSCFSEFLFLLQQHLVH